MLDTRTNTIAVPLARLTTAQLRVIARALRDRASTGRFPQQVLSREIARIERLIAARQHASPQPTPRRRGKVELIASR